MQSRAHAKLQAPIKIIKMMSSNSFKMIKIQIYLIYRSCKKMIIL